jgi:hypothetical protein
LRGKLEVSRDFFRLVSDEHVQTLALAAVGTAFKTKPTLHHTITPMEQENVPE